MIEKTQPYSQESEEGLLACLLLDGEHPASYDAAIAENITKNSFYLTAHQIIFQAIHDLRVEGSQVDEIIVFERLKRESSSEDVGGIAGLYSIQSRVETTGHAKFFAKIVSENHRLRQIIRLARESLELASEGATDSTALCSKMESKLNQISDSSAETGNILTSSEIVPEVLAELREKINNPDRKIEGIVATHLTDLNRELTGGGFGADQLIILAARPSVGKSSLAMNFAEVATVDQAIPTLVFSIEMQASSLISRTGASRSGVDAKSICDGKIDSMEQKKLAKAMFEIRDADLFIDETKMITVHQIRSKSHVIANRLERQGKRLGLIVIDYLQLISGADQRMPREQQISEMSRILKILAGELKLPVIVLSQLNRASERDNREPRMSDLRESGAIEQDADTILLLHRDNSQGLNGGIPDPSIDSIKLIIAKQREGAIGAIDTLFLRLCTRFIDAD